MSQRVRELGIKIGSLPTGPLNALTDVPGVTVGHANVIRDHPRVARTGVTVILPRGGDAWHDYCFAGHYAFNGNGEMTGSHWLEESGMLGSPIAITNTHQVGIVRDALVELSERLGYMRGFLLPVVAETYDGWLNDIAAFHLEKEHVFEAINSASSLEVEEGNVGGGTGMICHDFKGGIGTASRMITLEEGTYHLGALVQANYGDRRQLRVDGVPIGRLIGPEEVPLAFEEQPAGSSSIIVIIGTDAPLLPVQCRRLAQRATVGLARVGGVGHNGSGDIFLAFSTANHLPARGSSFVRNLDMLPHRHLNPLFDATADAVEESILNALCAAETMRGRNGRLVHALPLDRLQQIMGQYNTLR